VQDQGIRRPSPNLLETVQTQQQRQAWLREALVGEGETPLLFVGTVTVADDATQVAHDISFQEAKTEIPVESRGPSF
jgi:hypothetical protein